ncbi:hypothetical protein GQ55_5G203200 [Panicum hallii var. hallii]|uniref:Uncharacterized protein n=2 Tax=Panicum hallii TaxID=206008 RepID=A0A2T7DIB2_9POAL|nr:hypothetical protein GQ55_5G203200 [Panicum hallii var. hallii]PVH38228.1 hypothetical protein PAHAL_5G203600 [Panicum hallii]
MPHLLLALLPVPMVELGAAVTTRSAAAATWPAFGDPSEQPVRNKPHR